MDGAPPVVAAVVAAILVVAGVGMWVWHEQPSFCGAICHTPMDNYLTTYESDLNSPATDKWGNEVADPHTMLAAYHGKLGNDCMDCHVPTLSEQIGEGAAWVAGNYNFPLVERTASELTKASGRDADELCLNEACHNLTRDDLYEKTADHGHLQPPLGPSRRAGMHHLSQGPSRFGHVLHSVPRPGRGA